MKSSAAIRRTHVIHRRAVPAVIVFAIMLVAGAPWGWSATRKGRYDGKIIDGREKDAFIDLNIGGGETETELDFVRMQGDGGIAFAFPFGTRRCVLVLDAQSDAGPVSGLDRVNDVSILEPDNPTARYGSLIETGKRHRLVIQSHRNHVMVDLDDKRIVDYEGPCTSVADSTIMAASLPQQRRLQAIKSLVMIDRFTAKMANWRPVREVLPVGAVQQQPGEGTLAEEPKFAASFGESMAFATSEQQLFDFKEPFTIELWYRQSDVPQQWLHLLYGSIRVELRSKGVFTKKPEASLSNPSSGISGPIASINDDKWHHLALCHDRYYVELFLDGNWVCKSPSAYFIRNEPFSFHLGNRPSRGSRIRGFKGEIRDFRLSSIARYPRSQSFSPPDILGWDEHATLRLDLRTNPPKVKSDPEIMGPVRLVAPNIKFVELENQRK